MKKVNGTMVKHFIALCVAVAVVVTAYVFARRYDYTFHLSSANKLTLSPQTTSVIKKISTPLTITKIISRDYRRDNRQILALVDSLLTQFNELNRTVTIKELHPDTGISALARLADEMKVEKGKLVDAVVFSSSGRYATVMIQDTILHTDEEGALQTVLAAEDAFTNAILKVTQMLNKKLLFTTGHGEPSITDAGSGSFAYAIFINELLYYGFTVTTAPVAEVGSDTDCVIIINPQQDFTASETEKLARYLADGGSVFILSDNENVSSLNDILAPFHIKRARGIILASTHYASVPEQLIITKYPPHVITDSLKGYSTLFFGARPVVPFGTPPEGLVIKQIVVSSPDSWVETSGEAPDSAPLDTLSHKYDQGVDMKGPVPIALSAAKTLDDGAQARVVLFGDADFLTDRMINELSPANVTLADNCLFWLLGENDFMTGAHIPEKAFLVVNKKMSDILFYVIVVGIPVLILLIGLLVRVVRVSRG